MRILCDKPSVLKNALGEGYTVDYSPTLDIYSKNSALLKTLKGLYVSSKLSFDNEDLINYIRNCAKPAVDKEPVCHACYNYEQFDEFCRKYLDNGTELKVAYDVETTAAPFLSDRYKLAGFSLANSVEFGCYVILESIDYINPDIDKCLERLSNIIKTHNMLVFNAQHEYIATLVCLDTNLQKDAKHLDDAYSMALVLKTESFKADVFKLKLLCHRLLGTDNWASIIDSYIELAMNIASDNYKYDFDSEDFTQEESDKLTALLDIISDYNYNKDDAKLFIHKLKSTYPEWEKQDTLPYTLIPSKMIMRYGCYDSCYLIALFKYFETWTVELNEKLADATNKPNIMLSYEECVQSQIMSAILTINGIFIDDKRDDEVREKSTVESKKYYDKLWEVNSDVTGKNILREYVKHDEKQRAILEKNYLLPKHLIGLIPDGLNLLVQLQHFIHLQLEKQQMI